MAAALTPIAAERVFAALGDPTRRGIVDRLCRGPATVSALADALGVTLTAVGQHLEVLEGCGLARTKKVGRVRQCAFDTKGLAVLKTWIDLHQSTWERRLDRLGDVLDED